MKLQEFSWQASDGNKVYAQEWAPETAPKAAIALVHGLGEHTGRYAHVAKAFTDAGYVIYGCDLHGHGKTEGIRGYSPSYEVMMQDIDHELGELAKRYPGIPRFLYGHSMGGNLVLYYTLLRKPQIAGVITTAPAVGTGPISSVKLLMAKIFSRLAPRMQMDNGLDLANLSRDTEVAHKYQTDPLVHAKITARLGYDMISSGPWLLEHANEFALPLLLMQGSADHLVSPEKSREFASRVPGDVTFKMWDGFYHELHNEPEKAEVIQTMLNWLDQHIK